MNRTSGKCRSTNCDNIRRRIVDTREQLQVLDYEGIYVEKRHRVSVER